MTTPFIVFSLPRSRSFWLSKFLSTANFHCAHDSSAYLRSIADVKSALATPFYGACETAAAPFWRTLRKLSPSLQAVVVRRPVEDVVASLMRLGPFNEDAMRAGMRRLDAKLDQIVARWPGVVEVQFKDLNDAAVCNAIHRHCLGGDMDFARWGALVGQNLQSDFGFQMRYYLSHQRQIERFRSEMAAHEYQALTKGRFREPDELVFAAESIRTAWASARTELAAQHASQAGEHACAQDEKPYELLCQLEDLENLHVVTARSNGRLAGYLVMTVTPSLEKPGLTVAQPNFLFATPHYPGVGLKLHRAAIEQLRERGVDDLVMRAGVRADGPRLGALYRRLGATDHGQLWRISLKD